MFDPLDTLKSLVKHPSVSTDAAFADGMEGARQILSDLLSGMGFSVETVKTPLHPIILAERRGNPDWPHVLIYGHYDVQPPDPVEPWNSPPFQPDVRDGRLYGRGAADNKGPLLVHVAAVARLLENHPDAPLGITFLIEGEEEIGSPSFPGFLASHRECLQADFAMLSDTGCLSPDQLVLTTGLRGMVEFEARIRGARSDLHSGIYGGILLNPLQALVELCESLHSRDGRINIPGFYDDVLEGCAWEEEELAKLDWSEEQLRAFLGIRDFHIPDAVTPFKAIRFKPTLEFNGMGGGYAGEGMKTVIPSHAFVKISCRLVPNQDPEKIQNLLLAALKERCSPKVTLEIKKGACGAPYLVVPPERENTPPDQSPVLSAAFRAADRAIGEVFGKKPLYLREGGSIPIIADLKKATGLDSLMIGLCLPDANLHAPNENFNLEVFQNGIAASERILAELAGIN